MNSLTGAIDFTVDILVSQKILINEGIASRRFVSAAYDVRELVLMKEVERQRGLVKCASVILVDYRRHCIEQLPQLMAHTGDLPINFTR